MPLSRAHKEKPRCKFIDTENQQNQIPLVFVAPFWLINKAGAFADLEREAESSGAAAGAARLRQHDQWWVNDLTIYVSLIKHDVNMCPFSCFYTSNLIAHARMRKLFEQCTEQLTSRFWFVCVQASALAGRRLTKRRRASNSCSARRRDCWRSRAPESPGIAPPFAGKRLPALLFQSVSTQKIYFIVLPSKVF